MPAPLMPGAGGYFFEGGQPGCLLLHGFTGTPQNVRPLADYLARRGLTVSVPRIAGRWLVANQILWVGLNSQKSCRMRRARMRSPPVSSLTKDSASR